MSRPTPRQRRAWFRWQEKHGASVSETARHFGISRSTLYRWRERAGAKKSLRERPRNADRGERLRKVFFERFLEIHLRHPRWGRRQLHKELFRLRDDAPSPSTVGRWLREVLARCPVCKQREGTHQQGMHALHADLQRLLEPGAKPPELAFQTKPASQPQTGSMEFCPDCGASWECEHRRPRTAKARGTWAIPASASDMDRHIRRP